METSEYANLCAVEAEHWYYAGKRDIVRWWLRCHGPPRREQTLLDCGAGTGRFAAEMAAECQVLVLDDHEEALRLLRERFRPEQILSLSGEAIPLAAGSIDYVTALDVLEHVADDAAVVRGFARVLKPGGLAVVTVPASMALWSDWDVTLHHHRRYDRRGLEQLFGSGEWEILHAAYTNPLAYPLVWLVRRGRSWWKRRSSALTLRTEDRVPPRIVNAFLRWLFVRPACGDVCPPFGVSLLLVARRKPAA